MDNAIAIYLAVALVSLAMGMMIGLHINRPQ